MNYLVASPMPPTPFYEGVRTFVCGAKGWATAQQGNIRNVEETEVGGHGAGVVFVGCSGKWGLSCHVSVGGGVQKQEDTMDRPKTAQASQRQTIMYKL